MLDLILLVPLINQCGIYEEASQTLPALTRDGLETERKRAVGLHRGEGYRLDSHGVFRAFIEHLAGSLGRHLIGPIFWYCILGIP